MTLTTIPSLLAILFCAALFILLYQHLFPRPAPWKVVAAALASGILCTLLLVAAMTYLVPGGQEELIAVSTLGEALPVAVFRAGLPEETVKILAALAALVLFRRHLTAAAAFQIPLFVAVGFAIVENNGYSETFAEFRMVIAFGRGFMATFVHSLLAMIQGVFLMRLVVERPAPVGGLPEVAGSVEPPTGSVDWARWYFLPLGLLAAAICHSLYDWGFLPVLGEFLRTGKADPATAAMPILVGLCGIVLLFVCGLRSLRTGIRRAAAADAVTLQPGHRAIVARWRLAGALVMGLGVVVFLGAIAYGISALDFAAPAAAESSEALASLRPALIGLGGILGGLFLVIIGWVIRQKQ